MALLLRHAQINPGTYSRYDLKLGPRNAHSLGLWWYVRA